MKYRIEKDSMGQVKVPFDKYWGAQTQRSLENFQIGGPMPLEIIHAFATLKKACAWANYNFNKLSEQKCKLISAVCDEILNNKLNEHFPLVVWQTGSGTQTNMNLNEVIANRAHVLNGGQLDDSKKIIHPNDDVNMSQSSNDTFPSAMSIAALISVNKNLVPALSKLRNELKTKSESFKNIIKTGRTHFMDATPISFGQEFSGYVSQIDHGIKALENSFSHLSELAIGGTAVGTGLNSPKGFDKDVCTYVNKFTGYNFIPAHNKFEALASHDSFVETHSAIKQLAVSLTKIANDLRFMVSGPRCGLSEIFIPENEPGSSIMPGKINPTQIEALTMVCAQIIGNDTAITTGAMNGHFELNTYKPLIIKNFLESVNLLSQACISFSEKCVSGITINIPKVNSDLENSLMTVTALNEVIGYENASKIAGIAYKQGISLREAAIISGLITEEDFKKYVNPAKMI